MQLPEFMLVRPAVMAFLTAAMAIAVGPALALNELPSDPYDTPVGDAANDAVEAAPAPVRFDPAAMPEIAAKAPPLGWRYADLSPAETGVLRRTFKLPLNALSTARSTGDLVRAAVVAPLPNPNRPLLSVATGPDSKSNPFAGSKLTSFRDDPLKALGEMLGAVEGDAPAGDDPSANPTSDDPFGGDLTTAPAPSAPETQAEVEETADPFGDQSSPADDDPFGDF